MRFFFILLALIFAASGALFGALNSDSIPFDFYFAQLQFAKGAALLVALVTGWLLGGMLVYFSLVPGLRRRVRAQAQELKQLNRDRAARDSDLGKQSADKRASDKSLIVTPRSENG